MKKKGKNKIPAVDNSPPIVPNIEPQLQKKVSDELIKGFEWYFPNEHSTYRELIDRWFGIGTIERAIKDLETKINRKADSYHWH